jgi:hypothetical protein
LPENPEENAEEDSMTPQERQLIDDLFDRLSRLENTPRDVEAVAAIAQGLRIAPNAVYALVQTVLVQDEALKRANSRILELEQASTSDQTSGQGSGGFLDSMREKVFGPAGQARGSVPNVPPRTEESRPVWNSGQVMQQGSPPPLPPSYGQPYGGQPYGAPPSGGGGSYLGTAAATAAGMVGGSLLLNSIRSMMGGQRHGFGDTTTSAAGQAATPSANPWADQSNSPLAHDLGVDDVGTASDHADSSSHAGLYDQDMNDQAMNEDQDDMGLDSDDFGYDDGGDDGSSYA